MPRKINTEDSNLGKLQKVYRFKFVCGQIFMLSFIIYPLALFTLGIFVTGGFLLLIFVIPLSIAFYALLATYWPDRKDELSIYQNGFTYYTSRKGLQSCLWKEISHFIKGRWNSIDGVRKKNGEAIYFSDEMPGIDDLTAGERAKLLK